MAIFGKQLRPGQGDLSARVAALEDHIRYMQERLEFYARQESKRREEGGAEHGG